MNRCKGCVYWKWAKADRRHHCEKNKETTCKRRAGEKEHYRITIDVIAEPDGVDRCSDIHHRLYMIDNQLVPYSVRAEDVKYKVELLSAEAEKDLELTVLTWEDVQLLDFYAMECQVEESKGRKFNSSQEFFEEVLRRFNKAKEEQK